jgi:glycosyltransferase involved in cell wall biosynthesis
LHVCLVYDHVYPQTIGGTERWLRDLALRLAAAGHEVTYLTMRHWDIPSPPVLSGVNVVGLVPPGRVYTGDRRTLGPPLRFGFAVWRHLARHGRDYDVVHTAAFPYFPLLAAGVVRKRGGFRIFVDWIEVWTPAYWRRYAGVVRGTIGWFVQRACIRIPQTAFSLSRLHAARLVTEGYHGEPIVLPGIYAGSEGYNGAAAVDPCLIVYAGRHVREKRVPALVRAFARARHERADLRLDLYGDGPDRRNVEALVGELGLEGSVTLAGARPEREVGAALARAACLATASEREGYGLVVVEAAAHGTPSVVVAGPENAATELVTEGVNGAVAPDASPEALAHALLRVVTAGPWLCATTAEWFARNAHNLTLEHSLAAVLRAYAVPRVGSPAAVASA